MEDPFLQIRSHIQYIYVLHLQSESNFALRLIMFQTHKRPAFHPHLYAVGVPNQSERIGKHLYLDAMLLTYRLQVFKLY